MAVVEEGEGFVFVGGDFILVVGEVVKVDMIRLPPLPPPSSLDYFSGDNSRTLLLVDRLFDLGPPPSVATELIRFSLTPKPRLPLLSRFEPADRSAGEFRPGRGTNGDGEYPTAICRGGWRDESGRDGG